MGTQQAAMSPIDFLAESDFRRVGKSEEPTELQAWELGGDCECTCKLQKDDSPALGPRECINDGFGCLGA